jgi:pilus assembly protein CpaB
MKKAGFIAASISAAGSVGLMHLYLQRLEAEVSGGPKVSVLVAAEDVPMGTPLAEKALVVRDLPQAYLEARHVKASELKKIIGARTASGLKTNETLIWSDLTQFNDRDRVLSGLIQNGMRAVSIDGRTIDFDGLLRPGDRVDVLFTASDKDGPTGSTLTLLQNLLVLSAGGDIARSEDVNKHPYSHGSVTLSATVEQAQLLTQAQQRGHLTLTLRNADDIVVVESVPETTSKDLLVAKDRLDWRGSRTTTPKGAIEHVR